MKRELLSLLLVGALMTPALSFAQGRRGSGGGQQHRMSQGGGYGQQNSGGIQQRDRKRDGTGLNCPGCPGTGTLQTQSKDQTRTQQRSQTRTQSQTQTQTSNPK
jgi:hypothetical protein